MNLVKLLRRKSSSRIEPVSRLSDTPEATFESVAAELRGMFARDESEEDYDDDDAELDDEFDDDEDEDDDDFDDDEDDPDDDDLDDFEDEEDDDPFEDD